MKIPWTRNTPVVEPGGNLRDRWLWLAAGFAVLAVATGIRVYGAFNDLWLDEIWSWGIARRVASPWDVFTKLHHEINHYLNTLYLWSVGDHGNWPGYRIPSLVAGGGAVWLAGLIGRRRSVTGAMMAMVVTGYSYALVLYSSEARGYATAIFFSFLCFYAQERYLEKPRWPWGAAFSISAVLGLASHLTFAGLLLSAMSRSGWWLWKSRAGMRQVLIHAISCYVVPVLFLAALYSVDIRFVGSGGGEESPPGRSYMDALAWILGIPSFSCVKYLAMFAAGVIFCSGIGQQCRGKPDLAIFYTGVILVFPLLLVVIRGSNYIYFRYFIVGLSFLLILFSLVLADLHERGKYYRLASLVLLAVYLAANGWLLGSFFEYGRGHYREAVRYMAEHSKESVVTIGSDSDFRIGMILEFYAPKAMGNKTCHYCDINKWPPAGPEWLVAHKESFEDPSPPAAHCMNSTGNIFDLVKVFQTAPLSGLHLYIYHNQAM